MGDRVDMAGAPVDGSLADVRVIEVSAFVAAPFAGMVLGQLGADVIRVDPIDGPPDQDRWPVSPEGTSFFWSGLNKGKRSIRLDTRREEGAEIFRALVGSGSDGGVLLTNVPALGRLGGYDGLRAQAPALVMLEMMGNVDGSSEVDYTVQPATGIPMITGPYAVGEPANSPLPTWDLLLGLYAVIGIADAVARRRITGEGAHLSIALSDVAFSTVGHLGRLGAAQAGLPVEERAGNDLQGGYGEAFATRDGRWAMVVALTDRQWQALTAAVDTDGRVRRALEAAGADVSHAISRFSNRELISALLRPWFRSRSIAEVAEELDRTDASWSPFRTFSEVLDDHRVDPIRNDMWADLHQPGIGPIRTPGSPLRSGGRVIAPPARSPRPAQHTQDILTSILGLTPAHITQLINTGIIK